VVAVGASAGGVEALGQLVEQLEPGMGMAYVLLLHLAPGKSMLVEILARRTRLPVAEIGEGARIEPDTIFVMPAGVHMTITDGVFHVEPRVEGASKHAPIDLFFRSLAADRGPASIGIVLTGADSDGMLGLAAIRGVGGLTIAQDPGTAAYPSMPQHSIDARVVDRVLEIPEIVKELKLLKGRPLPGSVLTAQRLPSLEETDQNEFNLILELLRRRTGVDFRRYKDSTVRRRLLRRISILHLGSIPEYRKVLEADKRELDALYQDILIMVTEFFRDGETFEILKSEVFPNIEQRKRGDDPWRFWVVGTSGGQEAYTLGMSLLEYFGTSPRPPIQIFATDVNDAEINRAREGVYPPGIAAEVPEQRLERFFDETRQGFAIKKSVREICIFATHDVTRDPPFTRLDLITCRNVLIYFGQPLQDRLISVFHYALSSGGFLVLGPSESVGKHAGLFELLDKKQKVYSRKPGRAQLPVDLAVPRTVTAVPAGASGHPNPVTPATEPQPFDSQREADRVIATAYAPASIVIRRDYQILHFRGETDGYLSHPTGIASVNALQIVREGLGIPLRGAVEKAAAMQERVTRSDVGFRGKDGPATIELEVIPFASPAGEEFFLVSFHDRHEVADEPGGKKQKADRAAAETRTYRAELDAVRDHLEAVIRDKDASNEELRAAYEEIQSSNEELQSINEELETAKEELQSINEELSTVNEELQLRNAELVEAHDDLSNLLNSIPIPIILLDGNLRIRRFTAGIEAVANIIASDIGRPVTDIRMKVPVPDIEGSVLQAVTEVRLLEQEVRDEWGHWWSLRIAPYKTGSMRIAGAVLSFIDIDEVKKNLAS
jgi:two-component system, chemotaxis family, CheB/CheR fusion protein